MLPDALIVGLGNPGEEYRRNRHNAGFMVVDALAERHGIRVKRPENRALVGLGDIAGRPVALAKPMTYMNQSGGAVKPLLARYELGADKLLVVVDDVALPLGQLRFRRQGSAGGQNGLKSVISALGGQEFPRLRLGVRDREELHGLADYVLDDFPKKQQADVDEMVTSACDAIEFFLSAGIDKAMERYNRSLPNSGGDDTPCP